MASGILGLICAADGEDLIENEIFSHGRSDKLISSEMMKVDKSEFELNLSIEEVELFGKILGYSGLRENALCVAFPYMIPDNCSKFSGALLNPCLNNSFANKQALEHNIEKVLQDKLKTIE